MHLTNFNYKFKNGFSNVGARLCACPAMIVHIHKYRADTQVCPYYDDASQSWRPNPVQILTSILGINQ